MTRRGRVVAVAPLRRCSSDPGQGEGRQSSGALCMHFQEECFVLFWFFFFFPLFFFLFLILIFLVGGSGIGSGESERGMVHGIGWRDCVFYWRMFLSVNNVTWRGLCVT